jgi:hypothetical protein
MAARQTPTNTSWASIFDGQTCIGHVIDRGRVGYESFDVDDISLGVFSLKEAAVESIRSRRMESAN